VSKTARVVVLISGSGSNLQAIIEQIEKGNLPVEISLVMSNKADAYGLERAANAGIATTVIEHQSFSNRIEFDQALIRAIDTVEPDLVILAGFMRILTEDFVKHYQNRLINIHPSLLPKYPGTNTHQRAIDAGDQWHGASIHFVVTEVDAGPIILQGRIPIKVEDTAQTLQQRIHKIEHQLYPQAVKWFAQKRLSLASATADSSIKVLLDGKTSSKQLQSFNV